MTNNMEQLLVMIKSSIDHEFKNTLPTENDILIRANQLRESLAALFPVTDEEFEEIKKRLPQIIIHSIGFADTLSLRDSEHKYWYGTRDTDNYFWEKYKKYLSKKWSIEVVDRLDITTDGIMDNLGNPKSSNPFQRRGLLLGDVQSGKTATYTAICNKAADAGYQVVIVLAGMMENLREQTQERLDREFVGLDSKYFFDKKADIDLKNIPVGVGKCDPYDSTRNISRFTSVTTDFNVGALKSNGLNLKELKGTGLFVVKKNKSILNNLIKWLTKDDDVLDMSLLLIDDEADNASVNTNDPEKDPTAINDAIRRILKCFKQASYLGITATPFANIFIDPEMGEDGAAKDLFPRHFITLLPVPDNYIGVDKLFGIGDTETGLERIGAEYSESIIPIYNYEQEDYFVYKHKKTLAQDLCSLPDSLMESIRYFILATTVSDCRFDNDEHRSMLVNVSRFTDVQNVTAELIEEYVNQIKSDVRNYYSLSKWDKIGSLLDLNITWNQYDLKRITAIEWNTILKKLPASVRRIEVRVVNSSTGSSSLDYYRYDNGMRVIAVGGNSLSRGLTLEGLTVSYFYRNTAMYDTLLQMGRWFGYRHNYDDLFKIWMGEDSICWYGFITDAFNELKQELREMKKQHKSPEEFGLKVKEYPGALMVTARNKMRTGTKMNVAVTLSKRLIETPRLFNDISVIENNTSNCVAFIRTIHNANIDNYEYDKNVKSHIWKNVSYKLVEEIVRTYKSHPWNMNFQSEGIADYINKESDDYPLWDVGIPQGSSDNPYSIELCDRTIIINPELRSFSAEGSVKDMIRVNERHVRIGQAGCTKIGLEKSVIDSIRATNDKVVDSTFLIKDRKPLLLVHFMENSNYDLDIPSVIAGIGLGFPAGKENRTAQYVVNTTELKKYLDYEDLEEFDSEE